MRERAFLSRALAELRLRAGEDFIVSSDTLRGSDEMKMLSGSEKLCQALTKVMCRRALGVDSLLTLASR